MANYGDKRSLQMLIAKRVPFGDVDSLLKRSVHQVNTRDDMGWTPLHHAAYVGDTRIVDALVKNGADVNARTPDGNTPLHWALCNDNNAVVNMLIENSTDLDAVNYNGTSLSEIAKSVGAHTALERGYSRRLPRPSIQYDPFSTPCLNSTTSDIPIPSDSMSTTPPSCVSSVTGAVSSISPTLSRLTSRSANSSDELLHDSETKTSPTTATLLAPPSLGHRVNLSGVDMGLNSRQRRQIEEEIHVEQVLRERKSWLQEIIWDGGAKLKRILTNEIFKNVASVLFVLLVEMFRSEFSAALRVILSSFTPLLNLLLNFIFVPLPLRNLFFYLFSYFSFLTTMWRVFYSVFWAFMAPLWNFMAYFVTPLWYYLVTPLYTFVVTYMTEISLLIWSIWTTLWRTALSAGSALYRPVFQLTHAVFSPVMTSTSDILRPVITRLFRVAMVKVPEALRPARLLPLVVSGLDFLLQRFIPSRVYHSVHALGHRVYGERDNAIAANHYAAVLVTFLLCLSLYATILVTGYGVNAIFLLLDVLRRHGWIVTPVTNSTTITGTSLMTRYQPVLNWRNIAMCISPRTITSTMELDNVSAASALYAFHGWSWLPNEIIHQYGIAVTAVLGVASFFGTAWTYLHAILAFLYVFLKTRLRRFKRWLLRSLGFAIDDEIEVQLARVKRPHSSSLSAINSPVSGFSSPDFSKNNPHVRRSVTVNGNGGSIYGVTDSDLDTVGSTSSNMLPAPSLLTSPASFSHNRSISTGIMKRSDTHIGCHAYGLTELSPPDAQCLSCFDEENGISHLSPKIFPRKRLPRGTSVSESIAHSITERRRVSFHDGYASEVGDTSACARNTKITSALSFSESAASSIDESFTEEPTLNIAGQSLGKKKRRRRTKRRPKSTTSVETTSTSNSDRYSLY